MFNVQQLGRFIVKLRTTDSAKDRNFGGVLTIYNFVSFINEKYLNFN